MVQVKNNEARLRILRFKDGESVQLLPGAVTEVDDALWEQLTKKVLKVGGKTVPYLSLLEKGGAIEVVGKGKSVTPSPPPPMPEHDDKKFKGK